MWVHIIFKSKIFKDMTDLLVSIAPFNENHIFPTRPGHRWDMKRKIQAFLNNERVGRKRVLNSSILWRGCELWPQLTLILKPAEAVEKSEQIVGLHWRFGTSWRPLWNQVCVPPDWQELRREGPGHFIGIQHLYHEASSYRCNIYYLEGYEPSLQVISWPCFTDLVFKAFIFTGHRNPVPFLLSIKECVCIKMQPGLVYTGVAPKLC